MIRRFEGIKFILEAQVNDSSSCVNNRFQKKNTELKKEFGANVSRSGY